MTDGLVEALRELGRHGDWPAIAAEAADEIERAWAARDSAVADLEAHTAAEVRRAVAAERERWEEALRKTWRMVDPLRPAGTPGSYARGQDSGIVAALKTLRQNLGPNVRVQRAPPKEDRVTTTDAGGAPLERGVMPAATARRFGRFTAPAQWAHEFRTELKRVMGLCIVFRAEHLFDSDQIEYWAASEHFRHVPLGEVCPEYRWHFTTDGDVWCEEVKT